MYRFTEGESCCDCRRHCLRSLKGCSSMYYAFDCSHNWLTTLEDGPLFVDTYFCCDNNRLTSLKGCPKVCQFLFCNNNKQLEDISDMPSTLKQIHIKNCPNIKVFTTEINNENGLLKFCYVTNKVRKRIKQWKYYDVVEENFVSTGDKSFCDMLVKIKPDNEMFMDSL